jgi:hypothetical protein
MSVWYSRWPLSESIRRRFDLSTWQGRSDRGILSQGWNNISVAGLRLTPAVKPWSLTGTETYSMEMQHVIAIVAVTLLLTANVLAQDRCEGLVQVGYRDWSIIIDKRGSFVCEFETYSKIGDQILADCPDSSMCSISLPLRGDPGAIIEHGSMKTIVEVRSIQRIEK